jgi:hypothetical protein
LRSLGLFWTELSSASNNISWVVAELIFNLGEVEISEWEDHVPRKVIVPVSMFDQTIHHGVHRNLKHISVVSCLSTVGESMTLFMVSSRVNDTVIEKLKTDGFRLGFDMILKHRQKLYMTAALFQQ